MNQRAGAVKEGHIADGVLVMHAPAENCDFIKKRLADDIKRKSHQRQSPTEFRGPAQSGSQSGPESICGGNKLNAAFGNPGVMIPVVILFHGWQSVAGIWSNGRWSILEATATFHQEFTLSRCSGKL
jgi:hypothetical protein